MTTDLYALWNILEEKNIERVDYRLDSSYGSEISLKIENAISKADFVFAVLQSEAANKNVYFELGIAFAKNKPIFLLTDSSDAIPLLIKDIFYVQAKPSDFGAIKYNLDLFLEHHKTRIKKARQQKKKERVNKKDKQPSTEVFFDEAARAESQFQVAQVLSLAFKRADYQVQENPRSEKAADLVVWINQIQSSIGNPILVEIKAGNLTENRIRDGLAQLRISLINTGGQIGMLVYKDARGLQYPAIENKGWPLMFIFSVDEVLGLLTRGELPDHLIRERNRVIHGST